MTRGRVVLRYVLVASLALAFVVVAFVNAVALDEAYGSGPPYYDRTTNMDKWTSPLPELITLDLAFLLVACVALFTHRRWSGART